ncbi:cupin domain-containing protein [uncultured Roseobacter sp.]|uniref:(R)-mandelonitrile lyase n=1 Tax=uncultured Roseobacter sp. TaxID=114847 RepID=UPI0026233388|nr:cupin domain-containing protein [uncultured Roseobacter sp.]
MDVTRAGSKPSETGPADYFTGAVRMDPVISAPEPARLRAVMVTFEPGARTAWHTHPLGQTLIVTSGVGRAQTEGQPVQTLRPGDVVWIPPGEKHWHGAAPDTGMSHLALQEAQNGVAAVWMEQVSEADYMQVAEDG